MTKQRHSPVIFKLSETTPNNPIGRCWRNSLLICIGLNFSKNVSLASCNSHIYVTIACLWIEINGIQKFALLACISTIRTNLTTVDTFGKSDVCTMWFSNESQEIPCSIVRLWKWFSLCWQNTANLPTPGNVLPTKLQYHQAWHKTNPPGWFGHFCPAITAKTKCFLMLCI